MFNYQRIIAGNKCEMKRKLLSHNNFVYKRVMLKPQTILQTAEVALYTLAKKISRTKWSDLKFINLF